MKIAVTARFLGGRLEGLGQYTNELLARLITANPQDEWHIIYDRKDDRLLIDAENVKNYFLCPQTRHPFLISFWLDYRLPRLLDKIKPDIVWYPDGVMSITCNYRSILTIHDLAYLSYPEGSRKRDLRFYKKYVPRYIEKADQIITISNYSRLTIDDNFSLQASNVEVIYNGYAGNFKQLSEEEKVEFRRVHTAGKRYFLHLGSIHPRKNVTNLVKAFELFKISGSDYKLVIAGRMAWQSNEVQLAISGSIYKADIIHMDQLDDILYGLVGSAEALCSLSIVEGFGLPVLEAMASGVSVIVSQESAMSEVSGEAGLTVHPMDITAISKMLKTVATDKALCQPRINVGLQRAQQFDWNKASQQVYNVLQNIGQGSDS